MWKARQAADALGLTYEVFLEHCFDFHLRRRRKAMPQPNQLLPTDSQRDAWRDALSRRWNGDGFSLAPASMQLMPHYRRENYLGLPAQKAMIEALLAEAQATPNAQRFVGRQLLVTRYLDDR